MTKLQQAVNEMASRLAGLDDPRPFTLMTCLELDSIAGVLRQGGHDGVADFITALHASGDEEGDEHYTEVEA